MVTLSDGWYLVYWSGCEVAHLPSQLTSDHLTQARATLRLVRPSGRSPKQCCNLCIHLFSLRVPHESAHKVFVPSLAKLTTGTLTSSSFTPPTSPSAKCVSPTKFHSTKCLTNRPITYTHHLSQHYHDLFDAFLFEPDNIVQSSELLIPNLPSGSYRTLLDSQQCFWLKTPAGLCPYNTPSDY